MPRRGAIAFQFCEVRTAWLYGDNSIIEPPAEDTNSDRLPAASARVSVVRAQCAQQLEIFSALALVDPPSDVLARECAFDLMQQPIADDHFDLARADGIE